MNRRASWLLVIALALGLAACGGGNGNGAGTVTYTVSTRISGDASGTVAPASVRVNAGQQASLQLTLAPGAMIDSALGCVGTLAGRTYTTGPVYGDCVVMITLRQAGPQLQAFASTAALESYLSDALAASDRSEQVSAAPGADAGGGLPAFSQTNIHEAGVDEADRSKSDGRHLFLLHREPGGARGRLRVLALRDTAPPGMTEVGRLDFDAAPLPSAMYLLDHRLALLGSDFAVHDGPIVGPGEPRPLPGDWVALAWYEPWAWVNGRTELTLVDATDRRIPAITHRLSIDGHLVSSRRIGSRVHLVTRFTPGAEPPLLPTWSLGGGEPRALVDGPSCYHDPAGAASLTPDLITVTTVNLSGEAPTLSSQCIAGTTEAVYVSLENLYLATTRYGYEPDTPVDDGAGISIRWSSPEVSTELHQFALTAAGPRYRGSGSVLGHLGWDQGKKSFRMGEHEGALRIATSLGQDWQGMATTHLSVLRLGPDGLEVVATLPNPRRPEAIGKPGERLYAARFMGDRAYLVTFLVTDPLYVVDLADPADPFIAGELEISGYSDYLQLLEPGLLLGIGKEAREDAGPNALPGAWEQGVKLSLFDVSNSAAPVELDTLEIGRRGTDSAVLRDHLALTWLPRPDGSHRIAIPVDLHDEPATMQPKPPWYWHDWTHTGLYLLEISAGRLLPAGAIVVARRGSDPEPSALDPDRSLLRGDEVHYLRGGSAWSAQWTAPGLPSGPQ